MSLDRNEPQRAAPPSNVEAEQGVLGAILLNNEAFWRVGSLGPEHFYEPFHGHLFASIANAMKEGWGADPVGISEEFRASKAYKELGGVRYLLDLVDRAPPTATVERYAATIVELHTRRELQRLGDALAEAAHEIDSAGGGAAKLIADTEAALLGLQLGARDLSLTDAAAAAADVMAWVDDREAPGGAVSGMRPLDVALGHMLPGDLIVIGGRPSMGKSALAANLALRIAAPDFWEEAGHGYSPGMEDVRNPRLPLPAGVIEISEMSVGQMARRHIADIGFHLFGKDFPTYRELRDKKVSVDQRRMLATAAETFAAMPITMLRRTGLKVSQLRSIVRRQAVAWAAKGIAVGLLIIDHVGLLKPEGKTSGRYEAQMEIAIDTKELAEQLGCPVIALVQLSRQVEQRDDKKPQLSDLRDAGGWEENADAVLFPFREAYYASREPDAKDVLKAEDQDRRRKSKLIEIVLGKIREGGVDRSVHLWGHLPHNAIRGAAPEFGDLM